jgi:hypothetical protein
MTDRAAHISALYESTLKPRIAALDDEARWIATKMRRGLRQTRS